MAPANTCGGGQTVVGHVRRHPHIGNHHIGHTALVNALVDGRFQLGCRRGMGGDLVALAFKQAKDRKSTRLNSSHVSISYAVFCLKKKRRGSVYSGLRREVRVEYGNA